MEITILFVILFVWALGWPSAHTNKITNKMVIFWGHGPITDAMAYNRNREPITFLQLTRLYRLDENDMKFASAK